jgi:type I restriction enzyme S subunit
MNGKQLKNSILQWAIQGKLVPQDPNDEPASVLLERIRAEKKRLIKEGKIKKDKNESIIFRGEDNSYYEKFDNGDVRCIDDEIPFDLPIGWAWCRISNLFLHSSGKQQSSNNSHKGTLQKFITTSNLYWGHFVLDKVKEMYFSDEELVTCSATKGDLLVCEGGAGYGRSAIWENDYDICLQNHIHRLRPIIDGICEYVMYYLYFLKETNQLASVGTAMPGLSANRLKGLTIPLPPLQEQQRIVQRVRSVMPVVDKYGHSQASLDALNDDIKEKLKKSILQEAIQGRLVSQDSNEEPASMLLNRIAIEKQKLLKEGKLKKKDVIESVIFKGDDNKYYENVNGKMLDISEEVPFDIPDTWCWCRVGDIVNILDSYRKPVSKGDRESGKYPYYGANGILDYVNSYLFDGDYILIGEDGSVLTKGGNPVVNRARGKIWVNNHAHIMASYIGSSFLDYLYYALQGISIKKLVHGFMPKYSQGDLRITLIPVPPAKEQARILERLNNVLASTMRT